MLTNYIMRVKKCATKALQPPIKVVLVKEGDIYVTHIYQRRECFRLDELARYKRKAFKTLEAHGIQVNCPNRKGERYS